MRKVGGPESSLSEKQLINKVPQCEVSDRSEAPDVTLRPQSKVKTRQFIKRKRFISPRTKLRLQIRGSVSHTALHLFKIRRNKRSSVSSIVFQANDKSVNCPKGKLYQLSEARTAVIFGNSKLTFTQSLYQDQKHSFSFQTRELESWDIHTRGHFVMSMKAFKYGPSKHIFQLTFGRFPEFRKWKLYVSSRVFSLKRFWKDFKETQFKILASSRSYVIHDDVLGTDLYFFFPEQDDGMSLWIYLILRAVGSS